MTEGFSMVEGYSEEEKESAFQFHYDRNERISNAPKIVQDYYAGKMQMQRGLFRILVATKFNRIMLFTVALFSMVVLGLNFLRNPALGVCAGFECELSAFAYGDDILAQIKIHPLQKSLRDKNFRIEEYIEKNLEAAAIFEFLDADGEVELRSQKNAAIKKNEFFLRTSVPNYDIIEVNTFVEILGERLELKTNIRR